MKKPDMLITKINHTEQSVEWEILRETYKQTKFVEVIDGYCKNYIGDFYILAKPSIATNPETNKIVETLDASQYSIRDSMEHWGEKESIKYVVSLLSTDESSRNDWSISLIRHKNRLYLFHIIKLNINPTKWYDKNGEPHVTSLPDIYIVYARSICSINYIEQITNLNKISELIEDGTHNFNFSYNNEFNRFRLGLYLSLNDLKNTVSTLRNDVDKLSEENSYTQIGFLSFNKCEKITKISMCKYWYRHLVECLTNKLPQLKQE